MATLRAAAILAFVLLSERPAAVQEITVTPEGARRRAPSSSGCRGETADPYAPNADWSRVPPWRQTSFFGIRARGKSSSTSSIARGA